MKKYKVVSLAVQGRGKKIHRNGDSVTEANFMPGMADNLVKQGHLKEDGEIADDDIESAEGDDNLSAEELVQKEYNELVEKGKAAFEAKDWKEAIENLTKALEVMPGDDEIFALLNKAKKKAK